jgi:hypothetical protein
VRFGAIGVRGVERSQGAPATHHASKLRDSVVRDDPRAVTNTAVVPFFLLVTACVAEPPTPVSVASGPSASHSADAAGTGSGEKPPRSAEKPPTSAAPLASPMSFSISAEEAKRTGLPPIGLRAALGPGGFTVFPPAGDILVQASGPPGGPLSFRAVALRGALPSSPSDRLRAALSGTTGLEPIVEGATERVELARQTLDAQAFRTGVELAATDHCLVTVPLDAKRAGLLLLFGVPASAKEAPSCSRVLPHAAFAELVKTLEIDRAP